MITPEETDLDVVSVRFMRALKRDYPGYADSVERELRGILGDSWGDMVVFGLLADSCRRGDRILISRIANPPPGRPGNLIPIIKEIRAVTGLGLKEAKDCVDLVRAGSPQEIDISGLNDEGREEFIHFLAAQYCEVNDI